MAPVGIPAALADLTARAQAGQVLDFAHQRLYTGHYVCVMRQGHPLADGPMDLDCGAHPNLKLAEVPR